MNLLRDLTLAWCRALVVEHSITAGELATRQHAPHRDRCPRQMGLPVRGRGHRTGPARTRPLGQAGRAWA